MNKKAEDYFHCAGENYNCAQAILKAFQSQFNVANETVTEYRKYGGGRADENMCGALFSAIQLLKDHPEEKQKLHKEFVKAVGSTKCKEIKGVNKISCRDCVKTASELLARTTAGQK